MEKIKILNKWWFWVIILIGFIIVVSSFNIPDTPTECNDIKYKLNTCSNQLNNIIDNWDDFVLALEDYCELDRTNNICIALIN